MFEARAVALEIAGAVKAPMEQIRKGKAGLGDQIERAVMSMVLNVGEASRRVGRDRTNRWRYASGSAAEARDALELAIAWQLTSRDAVAEVLALLDRELAMLWRLEHPRHRRIRACETSSDPRPNHFQRDVSTARGPVNSRPVPGSD